MVANVLYNFQSSEVRAAIFRSDEDTLCGVKNVFPCSKSFCYHDMSWWYKQYNEEKTIISLQI